MKALELMRQAIKCAKAHKEASEEWREGGILDIWRDEQGILCIKYASGKWWHYRATESGSIEWW